VADRVDKRRLLFFTQGAAGLVALALAILTLAGNIELWEVYVLATCLGLVNLFDNPARQTFVSEMVERTCCQCGQPQQRGHELGPVIGPAIGAS